ncbi:MAG: ATP-binding cassette domain-containing protein, partial [Micrococcales bacterium]|nr:ATP-binding cassette domain-containing protein [Micrococcales bacterium]
GPTGSGKSTLLQHIAGLLRPTAGTVHLDGHEVHAPNTGRRWLRQQVGMLFQKPEEQLFETYVGDDVAFGPRQLGLDRPAVRERADAPLSSVRWGRALLHELALGEVRGRVVVAESTPHLFTGTLADELDVRGGADRDALLAAMTVADAGDVLDSVPGGLDGAVEEKGRSLSGGQRQRVALARALLTGAEVLVLVEPTSAVDAHTEARIARRLADARRGATTVVVTASPLVLDVVDEVALVAGGRVVATGRHRDLVAARDATGAAYRAVVSRTDSPGGDSPVPRTDHQDHDRPEVSREAARR